MKNLTVRKQETLEIAENLKDDIEHLEKFLSGSTPNRAEMRMMSTVLRRMFLQQKELIKVAGPRVPNFRIEAPDLSSIEKLDARDLFFFAACGGNAFGIYAKELCVSARKLDDKYFPSKPLARMKIDGFLKQKTIFWRGHWFSRETIIAFAANKMGGAHTGELDKESDKLLKDLCAHGSMSLEEDAPTVRMMPPSRKLLSGRPKLNRKAIDFVLFDAFSSMHFLIKSPSTKELLEIISNEIE